MTKTKLHPKKEIRLSLFAFILAFLCACGSTLKSPTPTPTLIPTPTPTVLPIPTPIPTIVAGATYQSPAIVQIENLYAARPESGLVDANVVYEYSAEGGIGRFSAIYFSTPPGNVGPVRSARLVSPLLIQQYGGTLIYSGSSIYVYRQMAADSTPRFDENSAGKDMFRISSRYAPHNLYTSGPGIAELVQRSARPPVTYTLWPRDTLTPPGEVVTGFTVPISPSEQPSYTWRQDLGGWIRVEPDTGTFIDASSKQPVIAPTVIVMQVPARLNPLDIENGCCTPGWEYNLSGTGPAQVFSKGALYQATWFQPSSGGPPQFTLPDGSQAPISPGLVWIGLVPTGNQAKIDCPCRQPSPIPLRTHPGRLAS